MVQDLLKRWSDDQEVFFFTESEDSSSWWQWKEQYQPYST